jgi:hypothetical protein
MSGFLSILSMFTLSFSYLMSPFVGAYYLIYGAISIKIILALILLYQYAFCKRLENFRRFVSYCDILSKKKKKYMVDLCNL